MKLTRRGRIVAAITWSLLSALLIATGGYLIFVGFAPIPVTQPQIKTLTPIVAEPVDIEFPTTGTGAVTILNVPNSTFSYGTDQSLAMASITKLITALVVLDSHPLSLSESGPSITLTSSDTDLYWQHVARNGSVTQVVPGWRFSQRQMLEIMLIPSSNNYADSLAVWAFGSKQQYLTAAQNWLQNHDLRNTTVVDANGLDQRNRSNSADLLKIAELALADPVLAEVVSTKELSVPHLGLLENTNLLLHSVENVRGLKTGTTSIAGACLLWSVQIEAFGTEYTMLGVSLAGSNQQTLAVQVKNLFESAADDFQELTLIKAGESLVQYETLWGEAIEAASRDTLMTTSYGAAEIHGEVTADSIQLVSAGEQLGVVNYEFNGEMYWTPLISTGAIEGPDFWWRIWNPDKLW